MQYDICLATQYSTVYVNQIMSWLQGVSGISNYYYLAWRQTISERVITNITDKEKCTDKSCTNVEEICRYSDLLKGQSHEKRIQNNSYSCDWKLADVEKRINLTQV